MRRLIAAVVVACCLMPSAVLASDLEYDPTSDTLLFKTPAAIKLLEVIRTSEEGQRLVESLKAEIRSRTERETALEAEIVALKATIAAQQKDSILADFIVKNYDDLRTSWKEELANARAQRESDRDSFKALMSTYEKEVASLRSDLKWSRLTSIVGIILTVLTVGIIH